MTRPPKHHRKPKQPSIFTGDPDIDDFVEPDKPKAKRRRVLSTATRDTDTATTTPTHSLEQRDKSVVLGTLVIDDHPHIITRGIFKIGRDPKSDIVVNNPMISSVHVIIDAEADGITVQDQGSSNGSKKGTRTLRPNIGYNLEDGDILCLGGVVQVRFQGPALGQTLENVSVNTRPNFVPETPPSSLLSSAVQQVPETPSSDLNDSSQPTASDPRLKPFLNKVKSDADCTGSHDH